LSIIKSAHQKAGQILEDNIQKLHEIAKFPYVKEKITGEEYMAVLSGG